MAVSEENTLNLVQIISWVLLGTMLALGALFFEGLIVRSLLVGGILANTSFWLLKRDLTRLLKGDLVAVKPRFFIKYYGRLAVFTVLLFFVVKYGAVHVVALLIGLSTVFISIAIVAVDSARKELNTKEAS